MLQLKLNRCSFNIFNILRLYSTQQLNDEYTAVPKYPEILDVSYNKVFEREKDTENELIKQVKTVEEKQIKLNMSRYYGFKCYMLLEESIPYDNLTLTQHVTKTHLINTEKLPEFYNTISDVDINNFQGEIEDSILFELEGYRRIHDLRKTEINNVDIENLQSYSITKHINRIILNNLSRKFEHLKNSTVDLEPRIESYWYVGGLEVPYKVRKFRENIPWMKDRKDQPLSRNICYKGTANVALRSDKPLKPLMPYSDCENPDLHVPVWLYEPRTIGIFMERRHIANTPGFWPGDNHLFGLLSFHKRGHLLNNDYNDPEYKNEALKRQGILASFAWLNAQANFLGFTTYNDITYPLITQSVITNGKLWSFYLYQLNTILLHSKYFIENPKRNICWALPEMQLYHHIENGKLIGFNDEILKILIKFYSNEPELKLGINLTPYLSKEAKNIADYEDDEKRNWLENEYKILVSNRPRHVLDYEIYNWEKIYKIDNKTRFMDPKRRPFELNINPYKRKLNDRLPKYIPRALRPHLPKNKGRYAKEYFP